MVVSYFFLPNLRCFGAKNEFNIAWEIHPEQPSCYCQHQMAQNLKAPINSVFALKHLKFGKSVAVPVKTSSIIFPHQFSIHDTYYWSMYPSIDFNRSSNFLSLPNDPSVILYIDDPFFISTQPVFMSIYVSYQVCQFFKIESAKQTFGFILERHFDGLTTF